MSHIILGIDPGSRITGFAVIQAKKQQNNCKCYGTIAVDIKQTFAHRLQQIFNELSKIIVEYKPKYMAIEQVFTHKNVSSALKLSHARGVIMLLSAIHKMEVAEYAPRKIKQAVVGYGNAEKQQVNHMVKTIFNLSANPKEDAADALAIAICHSFNL